MRPVSSQPGRIYATAKTYTFNSLTEINVDNLKFRPIISQNLYLQCSEGSSRISKTTYVVFKIKYQIHMNLHLLLKINLL